MQIMHVRNKTETLLPEFDLDGKLVKRTFIGSQALYDDFITKKKKKE